MIVSLEWLNEFVDLSGISEEEIAHALTMSGLEVEETEKITAKFSNIKTARILEIKDHPNSDHLHLVTVFNGETNKEVVCGAQNIKPNQIIPYASVGSKVLDRKTGEQFELKPVKIRGIESEGMLCSADELGVSDIYKQEEDGILILQNFFPDIEVGKDLKEVFGIHDDVAFHTAPTANRGDQMSVIGIARELSAIFNREMKKAKVITEANTPDFKFEVEIKDEDTCKYYSIAVLKDLKTADSPQWMKRRLESAGVRSINNIVDITNYVMLEYGQPLHAFDLHKLDNYLCVRRAQPGETVTTLDGNEHKLVKDVVVNATKDHAVGLAGVMGGANSEIDETTTDIALESAYFTPKTNRRSSRAAGVRTEACARFERGVDIENVRPSLMRAVELLKKYADAKFIGITAAGDDILDEINITLRFNQMKRILGIDVPHDKCIEILENLGFELCGKNEIAARFRVPSYRQNDVTREIDLIEEIARIYGYDKIEPTLPSKTVSPVITDETRLTNELNKLFVARGFYEIMTSSLVGDGIYKWAGVSYNPEKALKVANPQSEDYTMLRQSLVPSILNVIKRNFDNGQKDLWLYEIGKTYFIEQPATNTDSGVKETRVLAGAMTGNVASSKWSCEGESVDFYDVKGVVENILQILKLDSRIQYRPLEDVPYYHPGKAAEVVLLGKTPQRLAVFGELHPDVINNCRLSQDVYLFEIYIEDIMKLMNFSTPKFKELPVYPAVSRDMAFIIKDDVPHQDIVRIIKKASSHLFQKTDLFDVYKGEHIKEGYKSVAYRIYLQDLNATLTDERVEEEMKKIKNAIKAEWADSKFRE